MEARRRYTSDTCGRSKSRTHEIWKTKKTEKLFLFFVGIHPSAHQDELLLLLLHMFGMMMNDHLNSATHHRDWANVFDLWWSRFPFPPYFLSLPSRANLTDLPTCSGIHPGALQLMNKTTLYLHLNIHACRFDIFTARNLVTTKSPHSGRLNTWHCCKKLQVHFFSVSISSRPFEVIQGALWCDSSSVERWKNRLWKCVVPFVVPIIAAHHAILFCGFWWRQTSFVFFGSEKTSSHFVFVFFSRGNWCASSRSRGDRYRVWAIVVSHCPSTVTCVTLPKKFSIKFCCLFVCPILVTMLDYCGAEALVLDWRFFLAVVVPAPKWVASRRESDDDSDDLPFLKNSIQGPSLYNRLN